MEIFLYNWRALFLDCKLLPVRCFVVASALRGPSAIAGLLVTSACTCHTERERCDYVFVGVQGAWWWRHGHLRARCEQRSSTWVVGRWLASTSVDDTSLTRFPSVDWQRPTARRFAHIGWIGDAPDTAVAKNLPRFIIYRSQHVHSGQTTVWIFACCTADWLNSRCVQHIR